MESVNAVCYDAEVPFGESDMVSNPTRQRWKVDPDFRENYNKLSEEFWNRYRGKHVAFHLDGKDVYTYGDSYEEVIANLKQLGIDPGNSVLDFLEDL
jgi:hypothetical protein